MHTDPGNRHTEPWIVRLYRAALGCFPEGYRREFGDELLYVVSRAASEAEEQGRAALLRFALRELRDLPLAMLRAHLRERKAPMNLHPGAHLPGGPLNGWQLGAVFLPFLAPLVHPLRFWASTHGFPWLLTAYNVALLVLLGLVCIAAIGRKFAVWALPGLGALLYFGSVALQMFALIFVFTIVIHPIYGGWPENVTAKIVMMLLVQLLSLVFMVVAIMLLLRMFPGFHARVRQEWTLLSFLLYGFAIFPVIGNDEFHGTETYEVASLLVLVVGAVLYLAAPWRRLRVLALVLPAVLSPAVMSWGLYQVFPAQSWAAPVFSFRLWEALQPVLFLAPLPVLLLLASLAPHLPWKAEAAPAAASANP